VVVIGAPFVELWSWNYLNEDDELHYRDLGYVLGLGSVMVFTFYGIWSYERTVQGEPGAKAMRDAIAASVVLMYLVLVSYAVFFASGDSSNPITSQLLTSFTSITGVVVAFYFTSVTVDQVIRTRRRREPATEPKQDAELGKDAPSED
jgi:protein-S-isoprenylcysteine O-methyltransferase Ste14